MRRGYSVGIACLAVMQCALAFAPAADGDTQSTKTSAPPQPRPTVVSKPPPASAKALITPSSSSAGGKTGEPQAAGPELVTLNFVNADIDSVVKAVSEITGKNFVVDPRVKGTVNIVSARPMSKALVYDVFLSALRLQGFAAVEDRGVIKLLPESDAKLQAGPTLGPRDKSHNSGDQIQTRVFVLKYESAAQMIQVLRPLIAPNNTITAYQNNNTLVITDFASNLRRIEKIIDSIDQPSGTDPIMIPLTYASALDMAQTVNRLFTDSAQGGADSSQRIIIEADTRSNSLLARSDNPSRLARLRGLVAMLDTPTSTAGNIHVVHLKNAEAVKVAETLRAIFGGGTTSTSSQTNTSANSATQAQSQTAGSSPATTPLSTSSISAASTGSQSGFIQADAATNSVIITAPDAIYNNLRSVLDKLDARRAQVYVEALIAEVTSDKSAQFSIEWQNIAAAAGTSTAAKAFGGTNFGTTGNILSVSKDPTTLGGGLNIGVVRGTTTLPDGTKILNIGTLIRALQSDSSANILSTPTLLTLDNEEARIVVGQNVPFITGQYAVTGSATTASPFQTIERKDVGLTLKIKPQISEGGIVRLQIYQEVSSVQASTATNPGGVTTNKRSIESTVLVDDGQIVVIGGLIQDQVNDGVDKIPLLGDIPLIGGLFQSKTRSRNKTNLMVFLRPVVLRDADQINSLTSQRYDQTIGEQRKVKPDHSIVLPNFDPPTLPPLQKPTQPMSPAPQAE